MEDSAREGWGEGKPDQTSWNLLEPNKSICMGMVAVCVLMPFEFNVSPVSPNLFDVGDQRTNFLWIVCLGLDGNDCHQSHLGLHRQKAHRRFQKINISPLLFRR